MDRYLVFAGSTYYPSGGFHDLRGSANSIKEALALVANCDGEYDWWHIVDTVTMEIVESG